VSESSEDNAVQPVKVDRMAQLWRRLKEHRIAQWTVGYIALTYAIQHGVVLTTESLDWPHAIERVTMILLALGLPVAMTVAWYHGGTVNRRVSGGELSILSALLTIGALLFYVFVQPANEHAAPVAAQAGIAGAPAAQSGVAAARSAAADPHSAISIAVLPFVNLSSDKEQEFFSDGMTEEITAALAKVPDLRVVSRTSAFEFKGKNVNLKTMADQLGATHLIEGSVRKAGNRLRITAQLIKADDDTHIWAEDYDRELTDVFAIQEDIARAITASLRMPLGLKPGENLVSNRNVAVDVYEEFLRLRAQARASGASGVARDFLPELETLVAREPNFAPAWAYLSQIYLPLLVPIDHRIMTRPPEDSRRLVQPVFDKVQKAAREAIRLDPRQATAYATLALAEMNEKHWASAEDLLRKAQEIDPYDPDILQDYGRFLMGAGRIKDALRALQQQHELEPLGSVFYLTRAQMADNQPAAAIAMLQAFNGNDRETLLAQAYAMTGRFNDAANTIPLTAAAGALYGDPQALEQAAQLIRTAPRKAGDPATLRALPGNLDFVYGFVGAPDRLLDVPERSVRAGLLTPSLFAANYAPVRKTEQFKKLVREAGLVDYWKARGWPDACHPVGADDFACE
jgi:TolB-like protein/tetratricopeptide (TPR) repeat protein